MKVLQKAHVCTGVVFVFAVEQKPKQEQERQPCALSLSQPNSQSCKSL